jgi:UDP-glucose 4-epimerase
MIKSLVTGGAGFIGSHIVDFLIEKGHDVIVIDDLSSDAHEKPYYNDKASYIEHTVNDLQGIIEYFEGVDYVFHLAAESRIMNTIENPTKAVETNTLGTCNVLEASRKHGVKRIVYSSTSSIYGLKNSIPSVEEMPPDCLNPYSVSKYAGEELCRMYRDLYGLETVCLRYFNVYGERQPTKGPYAPVIGIFQRQIESGEPMTIVGNGLQRRDFVHVSDVVSANFLAATKDFPVSEHIAFNIGTEETYSVIEIAKMLAPSGNVQSFRFLDSRPGEMKITKANIARAKNVLNWKPEINLKKWLEENK